MSIEKDGDLLEVSKEEAESFVAYKDTKSNNNSHDPERLNERPDYPEGVTIAMNCLLKAPSIVDRSIIDADGIAGRNYIISYTKSHPELCRPIIKDLIAHNTTAIAKYFGKLINELVSDLERIEAEAELETFIKEDSDPAL